MSGVAAARDLVSRPWARATWCALALVAVIGFVVPQLRPVLWIVAFGASGLMCVANAIRSRRFHCMYTGPIYLAGAVATVLRAAGLISLSWMWIGGGVSVGVVGALIWERARNDSAAASRCC
jgi:hypothetical protein